MNIAIVFSPFHLHRTCERRRTTDAMSDNDDLDKPWTSPCGRSYENSRRRRDHVYFCTECKTLDCEQGTSTSQAAAVRMQGWAAPKTRVVVSRNPICEHCTTPPTGRPRKRTCPFTISELKAMTFCPFSGCKLDSVGGQCQIDRQMRTHKCYDELGNPCQICHDAPPHGPYFPFWPPEIKPSVD